MLSILSLHSISLDVFFFFPGSYSLMCGHCTEVSFIIDKTLHRIVIGSCLGAVARHSSRLLMRSLLLHFLSAHCILALFFFFFITSIYLCVQ